MLCQSVLTLRNFVLYCFKKNILHVLCHHIFFKAIDTLTEILQVMVSHITSALCLLCSEHPGPRTCCNSRNYYYCSQINCLFGSFKVKSAVDFYGMYLECD